MMNYHHEEVLSICHWLGVHGRFGPEFHQTRRMAFSQVGASNLNYVENGAELFL